MVTDNKRKIIYDTKNKFVDTKPLVICNGKIVDYNYIY
jgi:hypothetical protein